MGPPPKFRHENCTVDHCTVLRIRLITLMRIRILIFFLDAEPDPYFYLMWTRIGVPKVIHADPDTNPRHCCCIRDTGVGLWNKRMEV
jgi:hypothetical protein